MEGGRGGTSPEFAFLVGPPPDLSLSTRRRSCRPLSSAKGPERWKARTSLKRRSFSAWRTRAKEGGGEEGGREERGEFCWEEEEEEELPAVELGERTGEVEGLHVSDKEEFLGVED